MIAADPITIRRAEQRDYEGVRRIRETVIPATYAGKMSHKQIEDLAYGYTLETHRSILSHFGGGFLVAEVDGRVVGWAIGWERWERSMFGWPTKTGEAELAHCYVLPEYQGQGIGTRLTDARVEYLLSRGYKTARIVILHTNRQARRFYEKRGAVLERLSPPEAIYRLDLLAD